MVQDGRVGVNNRAQTLSSNAAQDGITMFDEAFALIEARSAGPRLELFARGARDGWTAWGNQAEDYEIGWDTYAHNSRVEQEPVWAEAAE